MSEVHAVNPASLSRVKKSHIPSMFAILLVILDGFSVKAAMLPCYLRHSGLQLMVGNFAAASWCVDWIRSVRILRRSSYEN